MQFESMLSENSRVNFAKITISYIGWSLVKMLGNQGCDVVGWA